MLGVRIVLMFVGADFCSFFLVLNKNIICISII